MKPNSEVAQIVKPRATGCLPVIIVVGAIIFVIGTASCVYTLLYLRSASQAQGVVTKVTLNSKDYSPTIQFHTSSGNSIAFVSDYSSDPPTYSIGDKVKVFYDPTDPTDAKVDNFASLWLGPMLCWWVGVIWIVIPLLILRSRRKHPV